jgi:hypothetical protein
MSNDHYRKVELLHEQRQRYLDAISIGRRRHWAEDAIWRAADISNLLQSQEVNSDRLTNPRIVELLTALGWE